MPSRLAGLQILTLQAHMSMTERRSNAFNRTCYVSQCSLAQSLVFLHVRYVAVSTTAPRCRTMAKQSLLSALAQAISE